ncbi:MAG: MFS transporter [Bryobacterales bacterium]
MKLTRTQWLICFVAALGFAFDIYELLMLPLIVRPALLELAGAAPGSPEFNSWVGQLFYLPAVAGGIFGLLGGYLTDVLGRRRVLVWSILLYAFSAMAAGYATSPGWLLLFRCTTFIGVSVEFVAAVAWLAELFPDPKQRESVLGYTQAFSSIGGLLVTGAYAASVHFAESLPAIQGGHEAWRYTLISGVIPALPLMIIRPFLPESPEWARKKAEGTLKRASIGELFAPEFRRTTIVTTLMFACSYGAAFGAIQHLPRIVPGLVADLARPAQELQVSSVQAFQEIGGLIGRFVLALLVVRIVSRRSLIRIFQIPGLIVMPFVFWYAAMHDLTLLKYGAFLIGLLTVAQFSFWGNYLPGVYPVYLRGTGEGFAANIGGRMIGTSAAWVTTTLATAMPLGATPPEKLAFAAGVVGLSVYVIGFLSSFFLPEPKHVESVH